ncbi:hypothetical protein [Halorhodospira halochloris]|uniref:hypothetical protein n=1 Tax=Halorhodospira halochloris TaxID=1052 RepID=UPI001EE7AA66|nr:hypothetical protein [Halorhodospira halochloris]MCG5549437.1 hypothetical protein [Halorhodospira halochloris]
MIMRRGQERRLTPYTEYLLKEHLPSFRHPQAIIREALLRRGFLLEPVGGLTPGEALFRPGLLGTPQDDFSFFQAIGFNLLPDGFEIPVRTLGEALKVAERILVDRVRMGMTQYLLKHRMRQDFLKTRFGARIFSPDMDCGLASLVKRLPLISVRTVWSCDGHGEAPPLIGMDSEWDRVLFLEVMKLSHLRGVTSSLDLRRDERHERHGVRFAPRSDPEFAAPEASMIDVCNALHQLALMIENEPTRERALRLKRERGMRKEEPPQT